MEIKKSTNNPLAFEPIGKLMAKFSIPAVISMLVSAFYNIVDQVFIGQGVGMLGNAATNVAFPVTIICVAISLLVGIGGASNFNLEMGAGEEEKAEKIMGTALVTLVAAGAVIAVIVLVFLKPLLDLFGATSDILPYAKDYTSIIAMGLPFFILTTGGNHLIRADRSPTYSMVSMLSGAILNTILDPIYIFGFGWGMKGAAIATITGQGVSAGLVVLYFIKFKKVNLTRNNLRLQPVFLKAICALGLASFINQIAMALVQIVMNNVLRYYGAASMYGSEIPIACAGVIAKVNMVFMSICIGCSQGCQPLWGFNYGAKNYARVRETYRRCATVCTVVAIIFFLGFQLFPKEIVSIFGTGSEEYFHFADRYLRIFMFMTFLNGIQPMSSGFFTSIGKARLGVTMSLTRQIIFLLPLILIFPLFFGIDGVMYAGPIADGAAAFLAIGFAWRELRQMKQMEAQSAYI